MNLGLVSRTARHLSPAQIAARLRRRLRHAMMARLPGLARRRLEARAARLPLPDPTRPTLARAAAPVLMLQLAVSSCDPADIAAGRFTLPGRKFDFGAIEAIDWRGDFAEGANPLRRMTLAYLGPVVPLLASGRVADAALAERLLASFDAGNPFSAPGVFRDAWNPYAASHRLINILAGLALHRHAGGNLAEAASGAMRAHARLCAALIRADLERDLGFNHLLKNTVALALYAAALEAPPSSFAFLRGAVPRVIAQCVLADGGHAERAPMYHVLGLLDLRILAATELFGGAWQPMLVDAIARMEKALGAMSHPDGDIALFNDSWLGGAPRSAEAAALPARTGTMRLPDTGYVRLGAGGDAVIFDCGEPGPERNPGHAHADFLAVEASVAGRRLIVDPGVPTYTAGRERDESRGAAAHNGPRVIGIEPMELWGSFRVGRRAHAWPIEDPALDGLAPLWCAGAQSGYRRVGIEVSRYVGLWPGEGLVICDLWRGRRVGSEESRLLFPAAWSRTGSGFAAGDIRVELRVPIGRSSGPFASRCWPRYGVAEDAHLIALAPEEGPDSRRAALWLGWGEGSRPPGRDALLRVFDALSRQR